MRTPWLEHYWLQSTQAFNQARLAHALLISGTEGLGKFAFAEALAQKILCAEKGNEACSQCQSCLWFQANSHPDYFLVAPEEDKKQISIAQIRELTESLTKTPYGSFQVVIIHPAEAMNRAAANALLKTLEEPNGQVFLLLVTDHPSSLLPTIRSRCLEFRAEQPTAEIALAWLEEQLKELPQPLEKPSSKKSIPDKKSPPAAELLALADGLPLRALRLAQSGEWQYIQTVSIDFIRVLSGKMSVLKAAESWSKQSPTLVLSILTTLIQDLIRLLTGLSPSEIQHRYLATDLQALLPRCDLPKLWSLMSDILKAKRRVMSSANPNIQLLLESVLLPYSGAINSK